MTTVGSSTTTTASKVQIFSFKPVPRSNNFIAVGYQIAQKEGVLSLYKGLGAVVSGIVPKMAIRFSSFEYFKQSLAGKDGKTSSPGIFMSGLAAGATELKSDCSRSVIQ
jgi:solute carrier family 25 (mitochondrial citrate transporter), member 1